MDFGRRTGICGSANVRQPIGCNARPQPASSVLKPQLSTRTSSPHHRSRPRACRKRLTLSSNTLPPLPVMMFSSARSRITALSVRSSRLVSSRASYSVSALRWSSENTIQPNDPTPRKPVPNVSATNAVPVDSVGAWDAPLQEAPEQGERNRQLQAPNRATTWAKGQQPREVAMTGPRFEQTIMELQVSILLKFNWLGGRGVALGKLGIRNCVLYGGYAGNPIQRDIQLLNS
jgi:NADH dehydrogenase (ubiquinone) Fe-S protein 6